MVVDFDEYIAKVQKVLTSATYVHKYTLPEDERFQILFKEMEGVLRLSPTDYPKSNLFLFLLLNCDADFVDLMSEDEKFAHLIDTLPRLSQTLILRLILHLEDGSAFLQELVTYAPCAITIPLMEIIVSEKVLHPAETRSLFCRVDLSRACFKKLAMTENDGSGTHEKFLAFFKLLQTDMFTWISETGKECQSEEAVVKGLNFLHALEICSFCLKNDLIDRKKCWEGFQITCPVDQECCKVPERTEPVLPIKCQECQNIIIKKCIEEAKKICLDDWLEWTELEIYSTKTYQQSIGALAYTIKLQLDECMGQHTLIDAGDLNSILTPFALEPKSEDLKELSFEEIKAKFADGGKTDMKLLKVFLNFPDILEDLAGRQIIENNASLFDVDDVLQILSSIVLKINANVSKDTEKLRCLALCILKHLPLVDLIKIQKVFMEKYGASLDLSSSEFASLLQETFNRTAFASEDSDKEKYCELLHLSILNSTAVIKKVLKDGSKNPSTAKFMATFLHFLKPVSKIDVFDWISEVSQSTSLQRSHMDVLPVFILELVKQQVICAQELIKLHILPALHQVIQTENWAQVSMWLVTSHSVLESILQNTNSLSYAAVLVCFYCQILEMCQQTTENFSIGCVQAREAVLNVLESLKCFKISDTERYWIHSCGSKYSLLTQCLLAPITSTESDGEKPEIFEIFFDSDVKTPEQAACIIAEMLPFLTLSEWRDLAITLKRCFHCHADCNYSVFQSFFGAVVLLTAVWTDISLHDKLKHESCVQYIICCFGDILKHSILPGLKQQSILNVLEKTIFFICTLPNDLCSKAGIGLLPDLLSILNEAQTSEEDAKILFAVINACPVSNIRTLLETKVRDCINGVGSCNKSSPGN